MDYVLISLCTSHTSQHRVPDSARNLKTLKQNTEGQRWQFYFIGQVSGCLSGLLVQSSGGSSRFSFIYYVHKTLGT